MGKRKAAATPEQAQQWLRAASQGQLEPLAELLKKLGGSAFVLRYLSIDVW
jgi:hypothetical protein